MPGSNPAERRAVYDAMNAPLARLHCYEPAAIGLGDYGKGENYVARQVDRWSRQYRASETEKIDEMERLMAWLPANLPPQAPVRLVHGDYRLDNMILDRHEPRVLAVLDWELSTLGDPLADFTYHLMQWHMPTTEAGAGTGSLIGHDLKALGLGAGGARGLAHIAIVEALDEMGVKPVAIAGSSIGAVIGAGYAAGMTGRAMRRHIISLAHNRTETLRRVMGARAVAWSEI